MRELVSVNGFPISILSQVNQLEYMNNAWVLWYLSNYLVRLPWFTMPCNSYKILNGIWQPISIFLFKTISYPASRVSFDLPFFLGRLKETLLAG